jgi:hypothetical protein
MEGPEIWLEEGGPAFPNSPEPGVVFPGMSLRDYFAAAALTGLIMHDHCDDGDEVGQAVSAFAYHYADQMLKAREAKYGALPSP